MFALSPLALRSVALVAFAATACFTSVTEAADLTHASERAVAATSATSRTTASQLAEIQHRLAALTAVTDPKDDAIDELAQSLITVRGVKDDAPSIARLAALVADVLARGTLAEYELERLAQGLFAASSNVALPDHDGGLLAIDIAVLLQEAGADTLTVTNVLTALQRVCPAAKLPPSGMPARTASRTLSVLSRQ